jgi:hypothetical protein
MLLDEAFWTDHASWSSARLAEVYPDRFANDANWRREKRRARVKYPHLFGGENPLPPIAKYMKRARTEADIVAEGFTLSQAGGLEGFDLFETRNERFETVYLLLPEVVESVVTKPRKVKHRWATDVDGSPQPYMMVQIPSSSDPKLKIVPLADVHYGASSAMVDKLREYVNWIADRDDTFCFLNGDMFENAHGDSCRGVAIYEQEVRPKTQLEELAHILAPIAHKILWAHPGNHEDRSRTRDYDPLERLCELLHIPYSYEPIYVDILWRGNVFSFHAKHGNTSSQTKGGKMNAAMRPQKFQDFTMFTVMSHVHDGDASRNVRICRDRENFRLVQRKQYTVITPSFFGYFGSYASKAGYEPGSYGAINMELFANGDYHAKG